MELDSAERNYYRPCAECGGPQWEGEHAQDCATAGTTRVLADPTTYCARCGFGGYPGAPTHRECAWEPHPRTLQAAARRALYAALDELGGHADVAGQQELAQLLAGRLQTVAAVRGHGRLAVGEWPVPDGWVVAILD